MTRWQYSMVWQFPPAGDPRFEQMLNAAGMEGWEVVLIRIPPHGERDPGYVLFRRAIRPDGSVG